MYCIYCGEKLKDGYRFCVSCGKPIKKRSDREAAQSSHVQTFCRPYRKKSKEKRKMTGLLAASVLLLLVIIMGSGLLYSGYRRNEMTALVYEIDRRIQSEYVSGADLPSYVEYNNALLKALNYKVVAIDRKNHILSLQCTYIDALGLAEKLDNIMDPTSFYEHAVAVINANSAPVLTDTIRLPYTTSRPLWNYEMSVDFNSDFFNVLSGGAYYSYLDMTERTEA